MKQKFWNLMCEALVLWVMLFGLCVIFLVFVALSVLFVELGSTSFYLTIVNGVIILGAMSASVFVIRKCRTET